MERGVAQSVVCPRCAAETPPAAARFVTCTQCKLSFDTAPKPSVEKRLLVRDRKVKVSHAPDRLTLRYSHTRVLALVMLVLGLALLGVALSYERAFVQQAALGCAVIFFIPVPFTIMPHFVTVDARCAHGCGRCAARACRAPTRVARRRRRSRAGTASASRYGARRGPASR